MRFLIHYLKIKNVSEALLLIALACFSFASLEAQEKGSNDSLKVVSVVTHQDALNEAHDVELQGNLAYVAGKGGSIAIVNVEDPRAPEIIWFRRDTEFLSDSETVLLAPGRLFLGTNDFHSIDVTDPRVPVFDKTIKDRSKIIAINGMVRRGNYIFAASKFNYINAFDVSDPARPILAGEQNKGSNAKH